MDFVPSTTVTPYSTQLSWRNGVPGFNWHSLSSLNLGTINDIGIYVIKTGLAFEYTVYVGQGDVSQRLSTHLRESSVTRHTRVTGNLWVAWAPVQQKYRNGIERYLHDQLNPRESSCWTTDPSIQVNLP